MSALGVIWLLIKRCWDSFYGARNGIAWRRVRKSAIKRDRGMCQSCGSRKNLHVHHKNGWSWFPLERFDLANLVTLCADCHKYGKNSFHRWNGGTRKKCTKSDFAKWMRLPKKIRCK